MDRTTYNSVRATGGFPRPEPGSYEYKRAEAFWKQNISATHRIFCLCPNWMLHFRWPGYLAQYGSGAATAISGVVPGPLDGATITGHGSRADVDEAIAAAVHFGLDDSG
nr:hypothetical protein [Torque teno virus]